MDKMDQKSEYWDDYSKDFDTIYTHDKSRFRVLIDKIFRKDMYERFEFTMEHSQPIMNRSFLDVGCGPGYYSLAYAKSGAKNVVGIDYSKKMIQLAQELKKKENLGSNCQFQTVDIMDYNTDLKFDVSIAIGLFDYYKDPKPIMKRIIEITNEKVILSFPRINTWRAPVRKVRLKAKRLDVYFYSKSQLKSIFESLGLDEYIIEKVGKLYCAAVNVNK